MIFCSFLAISKPATSEESQGTGSLYFIKISKPFCKGTTVLRQQREVPFPWHKQKEEKIPGSNFVFRRRTKAKSPPPALRKEPPKHRLPYQRQTPPWRHGP